MAADKAPTVSRILVEADLLGHTTHGLQLVVPYCAAMKNETLPSEGEAELVKDTGSTVLWDGHYLPGPWLVENAIDLGLERLGRHPVMSLAIRRAHHTACLAAYLTRVTDLGYMIMIYNSDPDHKGIAPFGGKEPLLNPDPIAVGIPTGGDPILVDISTSTTSVGQTLKAKKAGKRMPGKWLMTADGKASDDPEDYFADPPGSILPLGGMDAGYKGFALMLMVEAMTNAMSGWGRKDEPGRWGCNVFIQILDPEAFGGKDAFVAESSFVTRLCLANPPIDPDNPVRMPGQAGLAKKRDALENGVIPGEALMPRLAKLGAKLGVKDIKPLG